MENQLIVKDVLPTEITLYDNAVLSALSYLKLPTENILTSVDERGRVFKNIEDVLAILGNDRLRESAYISKFFVAVCSGLFDAALNYLWDETISQLRRRVKQQDIQYFYDLAVSSDKRAKLTTYDDLIKVDDSELIIGAKEIGLISDIGYRMLDNIKYMRNWASAAHPNQTKLTGFQLISWLETCIKEVICLPLTNVTIKINTLLSNIKKNIVSESEANQIKVFFSTLTQEKVDTLINGFFGIYTRNDTTQQSRQNINSLIYDLWSLSSEDTKSSFGIKYAQYIASNEQEKSLLAKELLASCKGEKYIPDGIRNVEILEVLENLRSVHNNMNNFYNEPMFARRLQELVGNTVPKESYSKYVNTLVYVFLTNGYGVSYDAETYYLDMIKNFNQNQAMRAVVSFVKDDISSKLQMKLCKEKFENVLTFAEANITQSTFLDLIKSIREVGISENLRDNKLIREKIEILRRVIKS